MSNAVILQVICALFWAPVRVNCDIWYSYKAQTLYVDKVCSAKFILNEFFAYKLLKCLVSCPLMVDCSAAIYHRKNKTCYTLRSGFQRDDCSLELLGAQLYNKDPCPVGWVFLHRSCYGITKQKQDQASSSATCKGFEKHAHLVDITKEKERSQLHQWLHNTYPNLKAEPDFWIGAKFTKEDGWIWSDGKKYNPIKWEESAIPESGRACVRFDNGLFRITECHWKLMAICEINIPIQ